MERSRIPDFYKMSVEERVRVVRERGLLSKDDYLALSSGKHTLAVKSADKMIENVIGVMGLPTGLGLNFLINDKEYVVPLVVEEPSIVAALSSAAKLARNCGGFAVESSEPVLIGQVQVVGAARPAKARAKLLQHKEEILNLANSLHPKMMARGGGAQDVEVHIHPAPSGDMVVLHLLVNTCDAMGANMVNTMCEGVASLVESLTEGKVFLRILSNLTDRAMVRARVKIPVDKLAGKGFDGEQVRDGIALANEFASVDPYRATTHNKGVMNGVDAVALATGNDWRAIEASAHAYAARGGRYTALTQWYKDADGDLAGELEIPLKVGTVGGPLQTNPSVAMNHRMLRVKSARELAEVMGAVGLAQNFSALRALATEGIQQGHMTLHARSVATAAGAPPEIFDTVIERLVESGEIKIWKAEEIIAEVKAQAVPPKPRPGTRKATEVETAGDGHGKVILLGEHAVVYGAHAIAAPVPLAIQARVDETAADEGVNLIIPRWGVEERLQPEASHRDSFQKSLGAILDKLELTGRGMNIEVYPNVPRAMGLGGSSAIAVSIIRALDAHFKLGLTDAGVNALAYQCEVYAHGTPSGIDNTMATYGRFLLFKRGEPPKFRDIKVAAPFHIVIGMSGIESLTAKMVGRVRDSWQRNKAIYKRMFREIDALSLQAVRSIETGDLGQLGEFMNINQGLLNALQVSSWEIEELNQIARDNGALGAKLTGGGGGGSMIALSPDQAGGTRVADAIRDAGYQAMEVKVG
jgi:hydroxymethylglutaryl-CoA reductase